MPLPSAYLCVHILQGAKTSFTCNGVQYVRQALGRGESKFQSRSQEIQAIWAVNVCRSYRAVYCHVDKIQIASYRDLVDWQEGRAGLSAANRTFYDCPVRFSASSRYTHWFMTTCIFVNNCISMHAYPDDLQHGQSSHLTNFQRVSTMARGDID